MLLITSVLLSSGLVCLYLFGPFGSENRNRPPPISQAITLQNVLGIGNLHLIQFLTPSPVRVVRLWCGEGVSKSKAVSKQRIRFSLDLILMDSKGNKIGAHIKRELIYRFENSLKEGMVYYITYFDVDANSGQYRIHTSLMFCNDNK